MTDTTGVLPCGAANTFGADDDAGPFIAMVLFFETLDDTALQDIETSWKAQGGTGVATCNACCSGLLFGDVMKTTGIVEGFHLISFPTRTQAVAWAGSSAVTSRSGRQLGVVHRMADC